MRRLNSAHSLVSVVLLFLCINLSAPVFTQAATPDFNFDGFTATYYLGRTANGVTKLTVQEDMAVEFPFGGKFYGLKRSIPETYQGHNLGLKIISVTDGMGNPLPYKSSDSQSNRIIETGDHDIVVSGLQTYRIKYQTSGVVAFYPNSNEFLVDVNGRGWQETFNSVQALIHIPTYLSKDLSSQPSCSIGFNDTILRACTVKSQSEIGGILIAASTTQKLSGHQALLVKLGFKKGTFQQKKDSSTVLWLVLFGLVAGTAGWVFLKHRK